jgi:serine/threonine-protein kinase
MRAQSLVGQTVCETYVVERVLGTGTMGVVLEVRHVRLPRRFAMKVLHSELAEGAEVFSRFRREAEIASSLGHPNIVNVVDFNRLPDNTYFLIMEYLRGEDLHSRMTREGALPLQQVLELARQVGSALSAAHKHGVVHRDLKPQNIFLCKEDRGDEEVEVAKVLDFGISKILGDPRGQTGAMRVMGTPLYMAPEQAMGFAAQVDGRADQFALAAIMYHALSGRRPFDGASVVEIALKVMNEDPPSLRELVPDLPPHIAAAIGRALSKDREGRFPTISDFVRALGIGRATMGISAPSVPGLSPDPALAEAEAPVLTARPLLSDWGRWAKLLLIAAACGVCTFGGVRAVGQALRSAPGPGPGPGTEVGSGSGVTTAPRPPEVRAPLQPRVRLRFAVTPPGAEIYLDGRRVESEVEVPRGERGLRLEIRAHGHVSHTDLVVPQSDQRFVVHLAPARRRGGAHGSGSSSGPGPHGVQAPPF